MVMKIRPSHRRMSESLELLAQIDRWSTIQKTRISESIELLTQIDREYVIKACRMSESVEPLIETRYAVWERS